MADCLDGDETTSVEELVAEDQVLAKSHMHYALEQLGFKNMDYVDRPSQALSALKEYDYDAIICSYNLRSEQGGYYLLEQLNDAHSLPLTSAFIFTSADTSAEVVHAIIELQPDEFIAKPFSSTGQITPLPCERYGGPVA